MLILFVLAHYGHHLLSSIVSPLLPFIRITFTIDVAQAGGLVSAFTIAYGISQLPAGWLADRLGQRVLIALGVSGVALCGLLAGIAPNYGLMIFIMVLLGLFGGGYHPASAPLVASLVEPNRRGWALGIHQIGGTASNLSGPLIAAGLAGYLGWRSAFMIPGAVVIILGIVLYLLIGSSQKVAKPVNAAGSPVKIEPLETHRNISNLIAYTIIGTAGQVFISSIISFMPLFMVDNLKESAGLAAALQSIIYLGGLPAGPLAGYFSDRVGARRMLIVAGLATGPVIALLNLVTSIWVSIPILLALGVLMYTMMPISEAYIINQTTELNRSTVLGIYYASSRGGSGFLVLGIGYLIKRLGFYPAFTTAGTALLVIVVGCVIFLWSQRKKALTG